MTWRGSIQLISRLKSFGPGVMSQAVCFAPYCWRKDCTFWRSFWVAWGELGSGYSAPVMVGVGESFWQ